MRAKKVDDVNEGVSDSEESVWVRREREKVLLGEEETLWDAEGRTGGEEGGYVLRRGSVWDWPRCRTQDIQQPA